MSHRSDFVDRHIGPNQYQVQTMLLELGFKDLDSFIKSVVPANIHIKGEIEKSLPNGISEVDALAEWADSLLEGGDGGEDSEAVCCIIDEKYVKNALKLLVIGGYVKQWSAFNYFKKWFKDRGFNVEIEENNSNKFASFIFEDYVVEERGGDGEGEGE